MIETKKLPKYVFIVTSTGRKIALRRLGTRYHRDGGNWTVDSKVIDGELLSWYPNMGHPQLHRKKLIATTKAQWEKCNGSYAQGIDTDDSDYSYKVW